jgi:hypothetical protein
MLPADLLETADRTIREGKARIRNAFVAYSMRHKLVVRERAASDAACAAMADDTECPAEAVTIEAECANASEETLRLAEAGQRGDRSARDG